MTAPALQRTMITELAQASADQTRITERPQEPNPDGPIWGDFRLGELLGKGAMGQVFKGVQVSLGRPVAVKVLAPDLSNDSSFRQRFLLEARMVARINSPHVIQVYGAGVHEGQFFFAMEYVHGSDLAHRLKGGYQPSPLAALHMMVQAVRGLVAAAAQDIVHRDLKPANMMVTADGQLKLMDFGLVKDVSDENGQTMAGTVMGTASYISPEQARGERCDQRTDIYSIGVVFYELLTRHLPFVGHDATSVIYQHVHTEPKAPREVEPNIPTAYQAVVMKCLRKRPEDRYQTALALLNDLELLVADPATKLLAASQRRQVWLIGGLAAAVVAGFGAAVVSYAHAKHVEAVFAETAMAAPAPANAAAPANPTAPAPAANSQGASANAAPGTPVVAVTPIATAPTTPATTVTAPVVAAAPNITLSAGKFSAPAETTVAVTVAVQSSAKTPLRFAWTLNGSPGAAGRIDAGDTAAPTVHWTAPGRPGAATLTVVARDADGHEATATIALTATPATDVRGLDLRGAVHWGGEPERALGRISRDSDDTWYATGADGTRVLRMATGWPSMAEVPNALAAMTATKAQGRTIIAVAPTRNGLYLLGPGAVAVLAADGSHLRDLGNLVAPSDLAVAADGTVFIADQGQGGIVVLEADGSFRCRLGRGGDNPDDFAGLTRIALAPDGSLFALDVIHRRIARFDHALHRLPAWPLPADAKADAVALAVHPRGLLLLNANGAVSLLGADGNAQPFTAALADTGPSGPGLAKEPGRAGDLFVDATGAVYVTYPATGLIARADAAGAFTGVRGAAVHGGDIWSGDGAGHVYQLDSAAGWLYLADADGWRQARMGGPQSDHGNFAEAIAVAGAPDGSFVEVLDHDRHAVLRFDPAHPAAAPLVFGQKGKNNGQFDEPADLCVDEAGRTYVLDSGSERVSVFDRAGVFLFAFGTYGRGAGDLKEPRLLAVSNGGDAAYVYDAYHDEIKKFTLDLAGGHATHVTNTGGHGDDLGQIRELVGLRCDRQGLLYLADSSRNDLQVIDFRGNSAVPILVHKAAEFPLRKIGGEGVSPDGQAWLSGGDQVTVLTWVAKTP